MLQAYLMRKDFFNHETSGFFKTQKRDPVMKNPMTGQQDYTIKPLHFLMSHRLNTKICLIFSLLHNKTMKLTHLS